jgi:hypothetical protein
MNVEIGTEAAQFPEKEYNNGIFVAVHAAKNSAFKIADPRVEGRESRDDCGTELPLQEICQLQGARVV